MIRFFSLVAVVSFAFAGPVWLFLVVAAAYGLWFSGFELIILGMFVDAFFGDPDHILPMYTGLAVVWLSIVVFVKPYLVLYNQDR